MTGFEWIAALLGAALAGAVLFGFLGRSRTAPIGLGLAMVLHVVLPWLLPRATPPARIERAPRMTEIELRAPEPPPAPTQPEPEPEPAPVSAPTEVVTAPEPTTPPRKTKSKPEPEPAAEPPAAPSPKPAAAPLRFDLGQIDAGSGSGIRVATGTPGGVPGGTGTAEHGPATGGNGGTSNVDTSAPGVGKGPGWSPVSAAAVARLPQTRSIPKKQCPATQQGVQGTVVVHVQVRRDGKVRRATVKQGIGHGCDEIAAAALRAARFEPATDGAGAPVDFELDYEYAFRLEN